MKTEEALDATSLRKWGEALKAEGNSLGDRLIAYADAWDAEVDDLEERIDSYAYSNDR